MELDDDKDALVQTFSAMTLAADDYTNASGDVEKEQIAGKLMELLVEIKRMLAKCNPSFIAKAFSPSMCKNWCSKMGRMPTNSDQYDTTRDIIKSCIASLSPRIFLDQYASSISSHLLDQKCSSDSKEFLLKEIARIIGRADVENIQHLTSASGQNLLAAIAQCLSDPVTSIFEAAAKTLTVVCQRQPAGSSMIFSSDGVVQRLRSMAIAQSVIRFRLHEFIGAVSIIDAQCLNLCDECGFIDGLLKEVDSNDILGQLNALTILTEMAAPKPGVDHCLRCFHEKGLLQKLNGMLLLTRESPDGSFLFPAVIKFFGHVSRLYPKECCEDFPLFLSAVFDLVINYSLLDVGQRLLAFDTLGLIGSTPAGKLVLAKHDNLMKKSMLAFGNSFKQGPAELRVRHIEALVFLIELKESDQIVDQLALTQRWFSWLERSGQPNDAFKLIFDLFRQPFPEIHLAAGKAVKTLASQPWAQVLMAQQAGFLDYLLNRTTEHTMDGRYIKYEIISILAKSPSIEQSFDPPDVLRLKGYVQEGPTYVKARPPDVAFEEA